MMLKESIQHRAGHHGLLRLSRCFFHLAERFCPSPTMRLWTFRRYAKQMLYRSRIDMFVELRAKISVSNRVKLAQEFADQIGMRNDPHPAWQGKAPPGCRYSGLPIRSRSGRELGEARIILTSSKASRSLSSMGAVR